MPWRVDAKPATYTVRSTLYLRPTAVSRPHARRPLAPRSCLSPQPQGDSKANPLELLRECRDPTRRVALLRELDGQWSEAYQQYTPSPAEVYLSEALGQHPYSCMLLAVQRTGIAELDVITQVRPTIAVLKDANIDLPEMWHLVNKQPFILSRPDNLQRWLDFLTVYGLKPHDLYNFCLRVSEAQFLNSTIHCAGMVITYLRRLGIKDEFLASRLISLWPDILGRDVDTQLTPTVQYLQSLGLDIPDITNVIMQWPEILLCDVPTHLQPLANYLQSLGCGLTQVAEVITTCPHLVRFDPPATFNPRLEALAAFGITPSDISSMVQVNASFLAVTGGFAEQLETLQTLGLDPAAIRTLLVACPQILLERPLELQRKHEFFFRVLQLPLQHLLEHPVFLSTSLMHVIGPRYYYAESKGLLHKFHAEGTDRLDLTRLVTCSDIEFIQELDTPWNEFNGFKTKWEKDYEQKINLESELNFKEELARVFSQSAGSGEAGAGGF